MPPTLSAVKCARVVATTVILVAAGCSDEGNDAGPPPPTRATIPSEVTTGDLPTESVETVTSELAVAPLDYTIVFEELPEVGAGVEGGWLTVPVDYSDPQGDTLEIWVTRHRTNSDQRAGVLLSNNGGPGVPASSMATNVSGWFEQPLVDAFDIVSWDPRGTGKSGGSVDCIEDTDYDRYFASSDITPDDEAERQALIDLAHEFADSCVAAVGELLPHLGTNNSARDMDAIREALGEQQVSYLGYSYGSELGAVWATLFPDTVRSVVLDGAAHPAADGLEPAKQQQLGFERTFNTFLANCSGESSCAFHNGGDAEGAWDALIAQLEEQPIPGPEGRPAINVEVAISGVVQAMYTDRRWPALAESLAAAANGDGAGLLRFHDDYLQRDPVDGSHSNLLESFKAITCADDADRLTPEESDARAQELIGIAPRLFPYTTGSYTCDFFPPAVDPRIEITGERAGPIVVIGTTGDPSTPFESSMAMADALEGGQLVTVVANRHTAYRSGTCINDIVHQNLIWLEAPPVDARCE
jgi:pimeloyl-ACP methyl ester carboxylesterase